MIWIDQSNNHLITVKRLHQIHPNLEIKFLSNYDTLEQYLCESYKTLQERYNLIFISRETYRSEGKTFLDIRYLLIEFGLENRPLAVYTKDRTYLTETNPHVSRDFLIVDRRKDLLTYIAEHLPHW